MTRVKICAAAGGLLGHWAPTDTRVIVRRFCRRSALSRLGLGLALLLLLAREANATPISVNLTDIGLSDGGAAPTAYITFTGAGGSYVDVYADPQTATNVTFNGSLVPLYCIDTVHENSLGDNYTVTLETPPITFTPPGSLYNPYAANHVAWILENVYLPGSSNTILERGAAQLLIWDVIDPAFGVNWGATNNAGLNSAYNTLLADMTADYNPNINYMAGVNFWGATHVGSSYQDMADLAPEPSSITLLVSGFFTAGGVGLWRRRRLQRLLPQCP
jgi:hypothetical protein